MNDLSFSRFRFARNRDIDFAAACLECVLRRHGELIARPPTMATAAEDDFGKVVAETIMPKEISSDSDKETPFKLVDSVLRAKRDSQATLYAAITRSISLIDFVRNATCTLQM